MINQAFESGIPGAWAFWHMTPVEINGRLKAHEANIKREREQEDRSAWMAGFYNARAYHQPKKYPQKPVFSEPVQAAEKMTDDDMKAVMAGFMDRHNKAVRVNGDNA